MRLLAMLRGDRWGDGGNPLVFRGTSGALAVKIVD